LIAMLAGIALAGCNAESQKTSSATAVIVASEATIDSSDLLLRVSDLGGEAVSGARVGWGMKLEGESFGWPPSRYSRIGYVRSDVQGAVRIAKDDVFEERLTDRPEWLYVLQPSQSLVAIVERTRKTFAGRVDVTLVPACRVRAQLQSKGLSKAGREPSSYTAYITCAGRRVLTIRSKTGALEALLPPGDYELESYAWDPGIQQAQGSQEFMHTASAKRPFTVTQDQPVLDLGPMDGSPSRLSQLIGQSAPELPTMQAWSNGGPTSLRELRGNVVVLDFWSWGCQPCLAAMPKLMKLREKFEGRAVVILAVHDDSATTFAEVDERCAAARTKFWGGHALPFLLAIDSPEPTSVRGGSYVSGKTAVVYGIQALPTLLLIDKHGVLRGPVNSDSSDELAQIIERLLAEP